MELVQTYAEMKRRQNY